MQLSTPPAPGDVDRRRRGEDAEEADGGGSGIPPPLTPPRKGEGNRLLLVKNGEPDPEGLIWRDGAFHVDQWQAAPDDGALPDGSVVVSKKRWLAEREVLVVRDGLVGLRIEPDEAIDDIAGDLGRFALVALSFPKFSDGRAFSTARLLREKHGFSGELRAVGNVLADQIPFMRRVGFDSYEVRHLPTRKALAEKRIAEVTVSYQPGQRGRRRD
jgi:uncharacterized protein (DUF934 family)